MLKFPCRLLSNSTLDDVDTNVSPTAEDENHLTVDTNFLPEAAVLDSDTLHGRVTGEWVTAVEMVEQVVQ